MKFVIDLPSNNAIAAIRLVLAMVIKVYANYPELVCLKTALDNAIQIPK